MPIFRPEDFVDPRITAQTVSQGEFTLSSLLVMSLDYQIRDICRAVHLFHRWDNPHVSGSKIALLSCIENYSNHPPDHQS